MGNLEGNDNFYTAEASGNLYITSAKGIQKRDQFATPSSGDAGMPAGIGVTASTTGASGFLANNDNVAYRAVFVREDANKNLLLGAPSNRAILDNTSGGTRDGSVRVYIPADVQIGDFARLYRSVAVANSTPPSDEM
ncbi:MAG: hypothetical protein GWN00_15020, partial [Aliifodinibius sp.]|nr:hypothetical protein [Fodinibius sp.]NIW45214.1 hypothetical protein [Gammaproteobacteria bacterium]NIY26066.1 hypothetical protein [Fodinibius sp.]